MRKYTNLYVATLLGSGAALCIGAASGISAPLKPIKHVAVEQGFTTRMASRDDNTPWRVTSGGSSLFGFMSSSDVSSMNPPRGVYEIGQYGETTMVYTDPAAQYYDKFSCAFLLDGCLYGYAEAYFSDDFSNFGSPAFLKVDFATGEVLEKVDIDSTISWVSPPAYNPEDGYFYFFTRNYELARATTANPTEMEIVKQYDDFMDNVISLAYCPKDKALYGVNLNQRFVRIDFDGTQSVISDIPDKNAHGTFQAAMAYAPAEDIFYWTYQSNDGTTSLYTVTTDGLFNFECSLDENAFFDWFVCPDTKIIPGAPESPVIRGIEFPEGSLSGSVSFTMPEQTQDGNPLPDSVDWEVSVDGMAAAQGQAAPGSDVSAEITGLETGNHEFGVTVSANGKSSETQTRRMWIGPDIPMAPKSVTLTQEEISWEATSAGVHGGYVDLEGLVYNVRIENLDGDTVFATTTTATTTTYRLDNPADLSLYTAYVSATSNGIESAESSSDGLQMGEAMTLPVHFTPTKAEFGMMTVFDRNDDYNGWTWNDERSAIYSGYSFDADMDDYLFLPAISFDSTDRIYEVSLDASAWSPNFTGEYLDVVLAIEPNYDGVIESLVERTEIPCAYDQQGQQVSPWKRLQGYFKVYEPGTYYIGIHCSSAAEMAGVLIRDINVEDGAVTDSSPTTAEDIILTAAPEGKLSTTVEFRFPTTTNAGSPIPEGEELTATIDSPVETVTVTGIAGATAEATLATNQGENEIGIIVSNSNGENSFRATAKVFTGQTVPSNVTNVSGTVSDDMLHLTLTWKAPATGENGGYIDPSQLTYNIYRYDPTGIPSNWIPIEKGLTECTYTFTPETQDYYHIAIEPVNIAGAGPMMSGSAWVGPAYTLPYSDDFSDPYNIYQTKPWRIFTNGYYAEWTFIYLKDIDAALYGDDNDKVAMYCSGVEGTAGRVSMPRFTTLNTDVASLTLNTYTGSRAAKVTLYGYSTHHSDQLLPIGTLPVNDGEEIRAVTFDLPETLLGEEWVQIIIDTEIEDEGDYFAMTSAAVSPTSGIAANHVATGSILAGHNSIRLINLKDAEYSVSTADGRVVDSGRVAGDDMRLTVPAGVYVVKAGAKTLKTIVR